MKLRLSLLLYLIPFFLFAEKPQLLGVLPQSYFSLYLRSPEALDREFTSDTPSFSLSPWPNLSILPITDTKITGLIIKLEFINMKITPFTQRELLFLERLHELWKGNIIFDLSLSEAMVEELKSEETRGEFLSPLEEYAKSDLYQGICWDLTLSREREDYSTIDNMLEAIDGFNSDILHYYSLSRYEKTIDTLQKAADYTIVKAFDFSGRHSTYENAEESIESFVLRKGYAPETLILGIPLYGRKFRSTDPGYWTETITYKEILLSYHPSRGVNEVDNYYFNGVDMAVTKGILCREKGLAGVALYELQWDGDNSQSLLNALGILFD